MTTAAHDEGKAIVMRNKSGFGQLRELVLTAGPAILLVVGGFWLAARFVSPAPPNKLVIAAASKGSPYDEAARRYRSFLAQNGVTLQVLES
jgi:hypothetical protein